ncbi:MAG TPA: amidophosphoribosyltransferase [Patescibacteria group bacterium]|nr:amidophosphoribosyltransferase [Patescibacteria group bacterium]
MRAREYSPLPMAQLTSAENRERGIVHNCGIAGVYNPRGDVAGVIEKLLASLNHRGQEGAGVVIVGENEDLLAKGKGLVKEVIDNKHDEPVSPAVVSLTQLRAHKGKIAIGQDRYSTAGTLDAWQPFYDKQARFGLVHNGNFTNVDKMLALVPPKKRKDAVSDSWVAHQAILAAKGDSWEEKIKTAVSQFEGAYSLIMQSDKKLFALRDPWGMRPLCVGMLPDGGYVVASEPNGFASLGAVFLQELKPGQGVVIDETGMHEFWQDERAQEVNQAFCSFEYVYIAKPNSFIEGRSVSAIRERLGANLARKDRESGVDMSNAVVVGVQDSGVAYASAYAHEAQVPMVLGLVKNNYSVNGRVFMQNDGREAATLLKHEVDPFLIEGKDVYLVDDSIVRGITMVKIIHELKNAGKAYGLKGPRSIHVRIASPRITDPCFFGVDFSTRTELANDHGAIDPVEEIRKLIGADSLRFTSTHELVGAITNTAIDPSASQEQVFCEHGLCGHCFTGILPLPVRREGLMRKKPAAS